MKDYTAENPVFSDVIEITEITDPAHADLINMAPIQLLQNTMVLYANVAAILANAFLNATVEDETLVLNGEALDPDATGGSIGGGTGSYTLPTATSSRLGGIKVGSGLAITSDGVLSADMSNLSTEDAEAIVKAGTEDMTDDEIKEALS